MTSIISKNALVWYFEIGMVYLVRVVVIVVVVVKVGTSAGGSISHIVGRVFTIWATREAQEYWSG